MGSSCKPHIVLIIARGEAVRNFLYSDTLRTLSKQARVTLLSLVDHGEAMEKVRPYVENIIPLSGYREYSLVRYFRDTLHSAHFRWLWSENVKYYWEKHNQRVKGNFREALKLFSWRLFGWPFANRLMLHLGTRLERWLSWCFRPTREFDRLFRELKPDMVFNSSHVHGPQADLPMRVAAGMGIPTAVFVFSWDNLTSRSRIFPAYDHYLMWNEGMASQLLDMYLREIKREQVHVTGTPQFDFHFNPRFHWDREKLCDVMGLDPERPFILYTSGRAVDFPEEYRITAEVIQFIKEMGGGRRPQLVVRTYIKGVGEDMLALAQEYQDDPDVIFPPILWDKQWIMPLFDDLFIYTNLLRHADLGINAASTVSLELMMLDKPVINLGFEPPGSNLPHWNRFARHVEYDHYRPVAASGGVMVARSLEDLRSMIYRALADPRAGTELGKSFISRMMGSTLDGRSGERVAETLLQLAREHPC